MLRRKNGSRGVDGSRESTRLEKYWMLMEKQKMPMEMIWVVVVWVENTDVAEIIATTSAR